MYHFLTGTQWAVQKIRQTLVFSFSMRKKACLMLLKKWADWLTWAGLGWLETSSQNLDPEKHLSRAVIASGLNILAHFIYRHWRQLEIDGSWL